MEATQNLQNQQSSGLQQPRTDLQPTQPTLIPSVPGQQDLRASELRVGNTSIGVSTPGNTSASQPAPADSSFLPLLWLIIPVLIALVIFWPARKKTANEPPAVAEPVAPTAPIKTTKKKAAGKSGKRKKSKSKSNRP